MQLTASLVTERKALPRAGFCHHQNCSFCFHLIAKQPPYNAETVADTQMLVTEIRVSRIIPDEHICKCASVFKLSPPPP